MRFIMWRLCASCLVPILALAACGGDTQNPALEPGPSATEATVATATAMAIPEPSLTPAEGPRLSIDPDRLFNPYSAEPIISAFSTYTDPGAVIYYDGKFHMFNNNFGSWPARVTVSYYTSEDGFNWTRDASNVFSEEGIPYAGLAVLASSVIVEDDGTWVLYFYTWEEDSFLARSSVGRATAPAPQGPWTADDAPVLSPGVGDVWDNNQASAPSVTKTGDGYVMYYHGRTQSGAAAIGRATSTDGITWIKDGDPVLTAANAGWSAGSVWQPNAILTPDGWVMLYKSGSNNIRGDHGLAFSADGIAWEGVQSSPVLVGSDTPDGFSIWFTNLAYADGTYYLFYELSRGGNDSNTRIFVATCECTPGG